MLKGLAAVAGAILTVGLMAVNLLGGLVAGIWLAALGKWSLIGLGFVMGFLMPTAFAIVSGPALAIVAMGAKAQLDKGGKLPLRFVVPGAVYNSVAICAWVVFVFVLFESKIGRDSAWPFLLWAYSSAMSPLAYMATGERNESGDYPLGTSMGFITAMLAFVVLLTVHFFSESLEVRVWAGVVTGVVCGVATVIVALAIERETRVQSSSPNHLYSIAVDEFSRLADQMEPHTEVARFRLHVAMCSAEEGSDPRSVELSYVEINEITRKYPQALDRYSMESLEAHSVAIESLAAEFVVVAARLRQLERNGPLWESALAVYESSSRVLQQEAMAYLKAAGCAGIDAAKSAIDTYIVSLSPEKGSSGGRAESSSTPHDGARLLKNSAAVAQARAGEILEMANAAIVEAAGGLPDAT